jgi:drug/metabolite transporter (DMT)-like permease
VKIHYLFPLLSSLLYVSGILFIKQATGSGVGVWRTSFISNIATALMFLPVLAFGGEWRPLNELWQPALVAALFIGGQVFTFIALQKGDVSVVTPVMGLKTVMVAVLATVLMGESLGTKLWIAAGLSAGGVALLSVTHGARHHHVLSTILLSTLAAGSFSLFDVLVAKFSPAWGIGRFLPAMFGWVAVFSLIFIPFFSAPLSKIEAVAWKPLLGGSFFLGFQGLLLICTLGFYGDATAINVIYSSRGLWSVIAVWLVGHWFANEEKNIGSSVFRWRLGGAVLLLAAIVALVA